MDNIIRYFEGEKLQCLIGLIVSIIIIAGSIYFLTLQKPLLKGMAYAFLPFSLFLLIICASVIVRTPKDITRVTTFQQSAPEKIQTEELLRMEKVMKSFAIIKKVEIALFLIGVVVAMIFWSNDLIRGIAIGLIISGALLYLFDHLAEARGEIYVQFLQSQ